MYFLLKLKILFAVGICLFVAFTGATKRHGWDVIKPAEFPLDTLPPHIQLGIANVLRARGVDADVLNKGVPPIIAPIIGGSDAVAYKYPWFVRVLYVETSSNRTFRCGGTIYNEKTIITAGHCAEDTMQTAGTFLIIAGDHNKRVDEGLEQFAGVDTVILHPGYRESGAYHTVHDIALLILDQPLNFSSIAVKPVPSLSTRLMDKWALRTKNCVVIGYGLSLLQPEIFPDILQELSPVPLASNRECHRAMWKTAEYSLTPNMICARWKNEASDCFGDSGGPVGCYDNNGVYYQVGMVSWGPSDRDGLCVGEAVYTRISKYRRWIKYFSYKV